MAEIGYQKGALATWTMLGDEQHETNPDWQWPKSIEVQDRMRTEDAQVGSVLRAVMFPIMSAEWMVDPAGARPEVVDQIAADFNLPVMGRPPAAPLRTKGRFSWGEHLRLALLELPFGHSFFEQVYKLENGQARLAKLAWRPPRTIESIEVAEDGGLVSITQYGRTGKEPVKIPVDRLVAYVNDREGGNWLGRSILRTAYKNWLLKDRILRVQALTAERNGLGVPVYTGADAPQGADVDQIISYRESEKDAGLAMAKAARAGEAAGASIPNGATFEFKGVTGTLPDTDDPIRYHDEQIARAVLAHFLNLGTQTGSWALGSTFANFFTDSLNAVAQHIADVTQQHVVEDLVDLNFGETEPAPRIVFKKIGSEAPATAEALKLLLDSGAIEPDEDLEAFMRQKYRLPVKGDEPRPLPAPRTPVQDQVAAFFSGATTTPKEES
ncbi:hypothetical protein C5B92_07105 [Rathayibacter sp. AY1A4]|uniref:phage portal protein family protein n=1 Tax=Rathayibacter sp. AY1A4 TaxID=2080522 RepID=UPI000CE8E94E|nr:DUF935 family protein [Rathayibacter sp. AY1A4]PPF18276.1 hypothetical protein C5B92_07105 [Rathayibacter sp. AY1A4]